MSTSNLLLHDASTWDLHHFAVWVVGLLGALEILSAFVMSLGSIFSKIPVQGQHLDSLGLKDYAFITWNKFTTTIFTFHLLQFAWLSPSVCWGLRDLTLGNTLGAFVALFVVYDFFYTLFHKLLHQRGVYGFVHKHHHKQHAPSRGNVDAVNVHPFEFIVGEYTHLLALYLVPSVHVTVVVAFLTLGGLLASLNHTRADITVGPVYSVKVHDAHHRLPNTNFGQYTMLWDRIFGFYVPHTVNEFKKIS